MPLLYNTPAQPADSLQLLPKLMPPVLFADAHTTNVLWTWAMHFCDL
jgi:hypothetical protein